MIDTPKRSLARDTRHADLAQRVFPVKNREELAVRDASLAVFLKQEGALRASELKELLCEGGMQDMVSKELLKVDRLAALAQTGMGIRGTKDELLLDPATLDRYARELQDQTAASTYAGQAVLTEKMAEDEQGMDERASDLMVACRILGNRSMYLQLLDIAVTKRGLPAVSMTPVLRTAVECGLVQKEAGKLRAGEDLRPFLSRIVSVNTARQAQIHALLHPQAPKAEPRPVTKSEPTPPLARTIAAPRTPPARPANNGATKPLPKPYTPPPPLAVEPVDPRLKKTVILTTDGRNTSLPFNLAKDNEAFVLAQARQYQDAQAQQGNSVSWEEAKAFIIQKINARAHDGRIARQPAPKPQPAGLPMPPPAPRFAEPALHIPPEARLHGKTPTVPNGQKGRNIFETLRKFGTADGYEPEAVDETFIPTDAPAGSQEKIEIMRRRIEQGLPTLHDDDRRDYDGLTGAIRPRED